MVPFKVNVPAVVVFVNAPPVSITPLMIVLPFPLTVRVLPVERMPPLKVRMPALGWNLELAPKNTSLFKMLLPVIFVIPVVRVKAFPERENPPLLNVTEDTLKALISFALVC